MLLTMRVKMQKGRILQNNFLFKKEDEPITKEKFIAMADLLIEAMVRTLHKGKIIGSENES